MFQRIFSNRFRRSPANAPDRVAFLHIPKSAGSSVSIGLEKSKFTNGAWGIFDKILFGGFSDFDSMHEFIRNLMIHPPTTRVDPTWDAVSGHLSLPTIRKTFPHHRVFTVMREPRTRLISHWLFWRGLNEDVRLPLGTWANAIAHADGPFGSFIQTKEIAAQTDNVVVRMMLGDHQLIPKDNFIDPSDDIKLLRDARKAMRYIGFVGLTEDKSLHVKIGEFIQDGYELPRTNVTDPANRLVNFSQEFGARVMDTLYARTRLDRELWMDAANLLFDNADATAEATFLSAIFRHMKNNVSVH